MKARMQCPQCGSTELDVCNYESMIVVGPDVAMFTMRCPQCKSTVSSVQLIPPALREEVRYAAIEVGAGMGRQN